jgi:cytoskeletal protein CcmA (bactofilin family)
MRRAGIVPSGEKEATMFGNKETKDTRDVKETLAPPTPRERIASVTSTPASVIGEKVTMNGTLTVEGNIVINGEVEGSVTCSGQLMVGKTGRVKADLDVGSAVIGGWVEGRVTAKERVELQTDSHLRGDIHAKSFVIQDGCFFQGNCTMGEAHEKRNRLKAIEETERPKMEVA